MTCAIKKLSLFTSQHHAAIQFPYLIGNFRILAIHRGIAYNISRRLCSRAIYQKGKHRSIKNAHHDRSRADLGSYIYIYVGIFPNPPKRRFRVKAIVLIRAYGRRRRHARACHLHTYTSYLYACIIRSKTRAALHVTLWRIIYVSEYIRDPLWVYAKQIR